jgi:hypothetical protein
MSDFIFVGLSILFFAVSALYVAGCRRLHTGPSSKDGIPS